VVGCLPGDRAASARAECIVSYAGVIPIRFNGFGAWRHLSLGSDRPRHPDKQRDFTHAHVAIKPKLARL